MRITEDGRVGIGTDKPESTLDVAGTVKVSEGIKFSDGTTLQASSGKLKVRDAGGEVIVESAAQGTGSLNRLAKWSETDGAGTLTDAAAAEVSGLTIFGQNASSEVAPLFPTAANHHVLEVGAPGAKSPLVLAGGSGVMEFWKDLGGGTGAPAAAVAFGMARPGLLATNDMVFSTYISGQPWSERLRLTSAGNVGIGTNIPTAKLHVNGNVNAGTVNFTGLRTVGNANISNVIGGSSSNQVTEGVEGATIAGGGSDAFPNRVTDSRGTVGGGVNNRAGNDAGGNDRMGATVGGGTSNTASGDSSTVSGGSVNTASGAMSTVSGGANNTASGHMSTVSGGSGNTASASHTTVGGGQNNTASVNSSTVPGGDNNTAAGAYSFAAGRRAKALNQGSFVWADSTNADFASTDFDQFLIRAQRGVGININDPTATLHVSGTGLFTGNLTVNDTLSATQGLTVDVNTLHVDAANNRVGIGTTMPESPLHVFGTARASTVRATTNAGAGAAVTVGERHRDNSLIGWGKVVGATGSVGPNESFGITVARDAAGVYTITLLSTPTNQSVPVAVAEVDAPPTSAASARLVTIDQIDLTHFKVYITNGSFAAVDNNFTFLVTGR